MSQKVQDTSTAEEHPVADYIYYLDENTVNGEWENMKTKSPVDGSTVSWTDTNGDSVDV